MSSDYNKKIINNFNIYNYDINSKFDLKMNIINKIEYNNDKFIKYNKIDNFSDLFDRKGKSFNVPPKNDNLGNDNKSVTPVPDIQGRTYDASRMWSPVSRTGAIYEWNRGVIGIDESGNVSKEKLDGTSNHHSDATVRVSRNLGVILRDTGAPFEVAINATKENLVIFQSEGDNAFIYFPKEISNSQYNQLEKILIPRNVFNYSFTYGEDIYEDLTYDVVLDFAKKIIKSDLIYNQYNF